MDCPLEATGPNGSHCFSSGIFTSFSKEKSETIVRPLVTPNPQSSRSAHVVLL